MASFDAIKTEVTARLGNRTNISSRANIWINDAYFELLMHPRFNFFEIEKAAQANTAVNIRSYDLPTDLWHILDIRDDTNNRKLRRRHWESFDRRSHTLGQPQLYARFGQTIELDPTPSSVVTLIIRYKFRPTDLVTGNSPITGREWDEVLTVLSVIKGFEALEEPEKAAIQRQLLEQLLSIREDVPMLESMDAESQIQVRIE